MTMSRGSPEPARPRVLGVVDADPPSRRALAAALREIGPVVEAESLDELVVDDLSLVVLCLDRPAGPDIGLVEGLRLEGFEGAIIAVSARASMQLAIAAMRAGACDVAAKPIAGADLLARTRARLADLEPAAAPSPRAADFAGFVGSCEAMRAVYTTIERVAASRAPVFVTGESGTGKEVAAEALHGRSGRSGRLVALNCGAIPRDLMESEIFGHARGAFTGATEDRVGAAELADGGTLFLDEICEMDLALQTKLLRVVQTGEVRPVGGQRARRVDVRFVCATNRDPAAEVAAGRFREDLYYRLCVLPLHMPPLRERGADKLALARAFLARIAAEEGRSFRGYDAAAEALIAGYDWPGNVRQLQNVVRRLVVMNDGPVATAAMLPLALAHGSTAEAGPAAPEGGVEPFWIQEKRIIERALDAFGGNLTKAAAALGIAPSTIYRKREAWAAGKAA